MTGGGIRKEGGSGGHCVWEACIFHARSAGTSCHCVRQAYVLHQLTPNTYSINTQHTHTQRTQHASTRAGRGFGVYGRGGGEGATLSKAIKRNNNASTTNNIYKHAIYAPKDRVLNLLKSTFVFNCFFWFIFDLLLALAGRV